MGMISFNHLKGCWFLDCAGKRGVRMMIEKDNHNKSTVTVAGFLIGSI